MNTHSGAQKLQLIRQAVVKETNRIQPLRLHVVESRAMDYATAQNAGYA